MTHNLTYPTRTFGTSFSAVPLQYPHRGRHILANVIASRLMFVVSPPGTVTREAEHAITDFEVSSFEDGTSRRAANISHQSCCIPSCRIHTGDGTSRGNSSIVKQVLSYPSKPGTTHHFYSASIDNDGCRIPQNRGRCICNSVLKKYQRLWYPHNSGDGASKTSPDTFLLVVVSLKTGDISITFFILLYGHKNGAHDALPS